jgi:hypothetical protein
MALRIFNMCCCAERVVWTEVEVASWKAFSRWVGSMMPEAFTEGELVPVITKKFGHKRR